MCCIYTHIFGHNCLPIDSLRHYLFAFRMHFTCFRLLALLNVNCRFLWLFGCVWTQIPGLVAGRITDLSPAEEQAHYQADWWTCHPNTKDPSPCQGLRTATVTIAARNSPEATSHYQYRRRQLGDWCTSHPNSVATRRPVASQIRKETACQGNFGSRPRLYKPAFLGF